MYLGFFFKVKIIYIKQILSHFFIIIQGTYLSRGPLKGYFCTFLPSYCSHYCTICACLTPHVLIKSTYSQPNIYVNISVCPQKKAKHIRKSPDYVNLQTARSYKTKQLNHK